MTRVAYHLHIRSSRGCTVRKLVAVIKCNGVPSRGRSSLGLSLVRQVLVFAVKRKIIAENAKSHDGDKDEES